MQFSAFSGAVTGTNVYKTRASWNGPEGQRLITYSWATTGTLTGTLALEESNSSRELIEQDIAGGTNYTDKATWNTVTLYDTSGTAMSAIAITNAMSDLIKHPEPGRAVRLKYTNATGSGTFAANVHTLRV
jgi:hypothetical protein